MKLFVIIQIYQSYDEICDVSCIESHTTEEKCRQRIKEIEADRSQQWQRREQYIQGFVDSIELPNISDVGVWRDFCTKYFGSNYNVLPSDFKSALKKHLRENGPKIEGYNPPECDRRWLHHYIEEVPCPTA